MQTFIIFSHLINIQDVLHVLKLSCNLLYVSMLTQNKVFQTQFFDTLSVFLTFDFGEDDWHW